MRYSISSRSLPISERPLILSVLTVRNPWALAIMLGVKDIENRDWPTGKRGVIGIHSSLKMTESYYKEAVDWMRRNTGYRFPLDYHDTAAFNGRLLGTVHLTDCVLRHSSPWFQGKFGFVLQDPQRWDFAPTAIGKLGFWNWKRSGMRSNDH